MGGFCEVAPYLFRAFLHIVQMSLESVHESPFSLSHIWYFAFFTGNAIDKIVGFAADFLHGVKVFMVGAALETAAFVNQRAISAPGVGAWVVTS